MLYFMEGGLHHGRVPIGNGVVDRAEVLAAAKSKHVQPSISAAAYQSVVEENEHLRERNESLLEENGVNRELILVIFVYIVAAAYDSVHVTSFFLFFNYRLFMRILERNHLLICSIV